jgi:hypothetical protein
MESMHVLLSPTVLRTTRTTDRYVNTRALPLGRRPTLFHLVPTGAQDFSKSNCGFFTFLDEAGKDVASVAVSRICRLTASALSVAASLPIAVTIPVTITVTISVTVTIAIPVTVAIPIAVVHASTLGRHQLPA